MTDRSQSEVELELYEEIIDMNYSTPLASRTSSPLPRDENESYMTHFNGPIVNSSEAKQLALPLNSSLPSRGPYPRYSCSLAGSYQEPRLLKHLDENMHATHGVACLIIISLVTARRYASAV